MSARTLNAQLKQVMFGHPYYFSGTPSGLAGHIGSFSILQAEDEGALRILLIGHPHLQIPGASIEAHEFLPLPGM